MKKLLYLIAFLFLWASGGNCLPHHSALDPKTFLNKQYSASFCLYVGNPARPGNRLARDMGYFKTQVGVVE